MSPATRGMRVLPALDALKIHETLFALPFTFASLLIAARGAPTFREILWITLAMLGARNFGMAMNRVIDKKIDTLHPKNKSRHLPSGRVRVWEMLILAGVTLALFLVSSAELNRLSFILAFPVALYLVVYSYAKRFTWASNLMLGVALAIGPCGAWVGVTGSVSWPMLLLSGAVALWAGAFDMVYHMPSRSFYIEHRLRSIPQRFGTAGTLLWAKINDACAILALLAVGVWEGIRVPYYGGLVIAAGVLLYKHWKLSRPQEPGAGRPFFKYNVMVSTTVFVFTLASYII